MGNGSGAETVPDPVHEGEVHIDDFPCLWCQWQWPQEYLTFESKVTKIFVVQLFVVLKGVYISLERRA